MSPVQYTRTGGSPSIRSTGKRSAFWAAAGPRYPTASPSPATQISPGSPIAARTSQPDAVRRSTSTSVPGSAAPIGMPPGADRSASVMSCVVAKTVASTGP